MTLASAAPAVFFLYMIYKNITSNEHALESSGVFWLLTR